MKTLIKPMLAKSCTFKDLEYPCYVSPKLDGVRALVQNGVVYSRSLKPIPNRYVQEAYGHLEGLDGELIYGSPTDPTVYRQTVSAVMRKGSMTPVDFYVFDKLGNGAFDDRYTELCNPLSPLLVKHKVVDQTLCNCEIAVKALLSGYLGEGYEGIVIRKPHGKYKEGRSTLSEKYLLKMKPYEDSEAIVIGYVALMHNANEAFKNELGQTAHSYCKEGLIETEKLGALQVKDLLTGVEFNVGTGFTDEERVALWSDRKNLKGRYIKYKRFTIGEQDKPRHPVFLGFRDKIDM